MAQDSQSRDFALLRMVNLGAQGGSTLAPRNIGGSRVPDVQALRVTKTESIIGGTTFTLSWETPRDDISQIDHYDVWDITTGTPERLVSAHEAPCRVTVLRSATATVILCVQTVLKSGFSSDVTTAPTVAANVTPANIADMVPPTSVARPLTTSSTNVNANFSWDTDVLLVDATGSPITITLADAAALGTSAYFKKNDGGANAVTLQTTGGETIDGAATKSISGAWGSIMLVKTAADAWTVL